MRSDFNVNSGIKLDGIAAIKEKSEMKKFYAKGGIPTARQLKASKGERKALAFAVEVGYPIIAQPDVGVGAGGTHKIHNDDELKAFYKK